MCFSAECLLDLFERVALSHFKPGSFLDLRVRDGVDRTAIRAALCSAAHGETLFDAEEFVASCPTRTHGHFSLPAGTVHCSGAANVELEISAAPYRRLRYLSDCVGE